MNTRVLLTIATMSLLAGAVPSGAADPAQTATAQPVAGACGPVKCRRDCEQAGGTIDECRRQCRLTASPKKGRIDPLCVQECTAAGYPRDTCEDRCTQSVEPSGPSQPDFPAPSTPRPGT